MTDLTALLDRNQTFAGQFEAGDLPIRPRLSTIILTCVDARVDPAHLFGLGLGDALVIRNTGGWITDGVLKDLAILGVLAANWPGTMQPELVVIHHTDCGMARLATPTIQQQVAERLQLSVDEVAAMAITDPTTTFPGTPPDSPAGWTARSPIMQALVSPRRRCRPTSCSAPSRRRCAAETSRGPVR